MFDLLKDKRFKSLSTFIVSYRFVMQLLVIPFLFYFGKLLMNYHQVQFMTTDKMLYLLGKPSVWLFVIIGLSILLFLLSFELSSVILLAEYEQVENSLFPLSLNQLKWTLKPRNLIYLPLLLVVIIGFHFGMNSIITDQFFIPEFIYDTIIKTPSYLMVYTIVSVLAFIIAFHLVFFFHNLFIAQNSIKEASLNSISMVSGNRINFLISAIKMGIKISLAAMVFHFSILFLAIALVYVLPPFFELNSVSLAVLFVINKILILLVMSGMSALNVLFITRKYHEYGGKSGENEAFLEARKSNKPKIILVLLMMSSFVFQGYGAYRTTMTFNQTDYLAHKTYVTSHRGNSAVAPENTLAAIRAAIEERADAAEIDVQLTKDGHVVVIHDYSLSRLANDPRRVGELTLEELKELEVGSWFSPAFAGEKIPTLEEVIEEAGSTLKLNIELKPSKDEAELAKAVINILDMMDFNEQVVISSLNKQALKEVKKRNDNLAVGYIVPVALGRFEYEEEIDFYSLEMSFLTKDLVEKIKNQGKEVHAWTVNSEQDLKRMQKLEVDNIITDHPVLANQVLATNIWERGILEILSFLEI